MKIICDGKEVIVGKGSKAFTSVGDGIIYYDDGSKYEGHFEHGLRNGFGTMWYSNGDKYQGNFVNDLKSGHGIYWYFNGDKYEGEFSNDHRIDCSGTFWYQDGNKYFGEFKNEVPHGKGTLYGVINRVSYEYANKISCIDKSFHNAEGKYSGEFIDGKINGKGIFHNGVNKYEGYFSDGIPAEECIVYGADGIKFNSLSEFEEIYDLKMKWKFEQKNSMSISRIQADPYENDDENDKAIIYSYSGDYNSYNIEKYEGEFVREFKNHKNEYKPDRLGCLYLTSADEFSMASIFVDGFFKDGEYCVGQQYSFLLDFETQDFDSHFFIDGNFLPEKKQFQGRITYVRDGHFGDKTCSLNTSIYEGNFKSNYIGVQGLRFFQPTGYGMLFDASGIKYEGDIKDGVPHGNGCIWLKNGSIYEGEFVNGIFSQNGKWIIKKNIINMNKETYRQNIIDGLNFAYERKTAYKGKREGQTSNNVSLKGNNVYIEGLHEFTVDPIVLKWCKEKRLELIQIDAYSYDKNQLFEKLKNPIHKNKCVLLIHGYDEASINIRLDLIALTNECLDGDYSENLLFSIYCVSTLGKRYKRIAFVEKSNIADIYLGMNIDEKTHSTEYREDLDPYMD